MHEDALKPGMITAGMMLALHNIETKIDSVRVIKVSPCGRAVRVTSIEEVGSPAIDFYYTLESEEGYEDGWRLYGPKDNECYTDPEWMFYFELLWK